MPQNNSLKPTVLVTLVVTVATICNAALLANVALTQAQPGSESPSVPITSERSTIRIDGSASMAVVNQALRRQYQAQFPTTTVELAETGTAAALTALLNDQIDLAALGRVLTPAEKAQGLLSTSIGREKIAIVVGPENPFTGSLTDEQFAKIFRGEITDWAEVGGPASKIRFVDLPTTSDTRQALRNYPVFKQAEFATGITAIQLPQENLEALIQTLGKDGLGYVLTSQVQSRQDVRIVPMHGILPSDPRYPFSQPRVYAYKQDLNPAVKGFLSFVAAPDGQQAIANAADIAAKSQTPSNDTPTAALAPGSTAQTAPVDPAASGIPPDPAATPAPIGGGEPGTSVVAEAGIPPWIWGLVPAVIGGALLGGWLLKNRQSSPGASDTPDSSSLPASGNFPSSSPSSPEDLASSGESVTPPASIIPNPESNAVEGAVTGVSASLSGQGIPAEETAPPIGRPAPPPPAAEPTQPNWVDSWDDSRSLDQQYPSDESSLEADLAFMDLADEDPTEGMPATEEVTELTDSEEGTEPADSFADPRIVGGAVGASGVAAGLVLTARDPQSAVEAAKYDLGPMAGSEPETAFSATLADVDQDLKDLPIGYGESRIVLLPRDPYWVYAYWDIPNEHKETLRRQGGSRLALRLYDVTNIILDQQNPHSMQQYDCEELARDWYLPAPVSDRDYLVEIGYLADDGRWLALARSAAVRVPPVYPTDWSNDQFMTLDWDQNLRGKTFFDLGTPTRSPADLLYNPISSQLADMEARRVAGSLFGSMQQVPESAVSSYALSSYAVSSYALSSYGLSSSYAVSSALSSFALSSYAVGAALSSYALSSYLFPSGIGMGAIPTLSGIGMSGVGFSASAPPVRPRRFWLVADAELIVYGATEPDATVTVAGQPIQLNPDGTFRFHLSFPDGFIDYPIMAVAADGEQNRSIHLQFKRETPSRNTNTKEEAVDEWL